MKKIKARNERKSFIWHFVFLFLFTILCFRGVFVQAGMNDSKLEKNRMEGYYAVVKFNGEEHLYYLDMYTLNGIVSYCVELGKGITTEWYHSTENFGLSSLSDDAKKYVQEISYFGYLYPGHSSHFYYMAAQELIWEYLSGGSVEWTTILDKNGPRINIKSYKSEILSLVKENKKKLSLNFINGGTYFIGDNLEIKVSSGDLASYEVVDSGHSSVSTSDGILKIQIGTNYVGREKIILKKKEIYPVNSRFYYYDNSQQLISVGNFLNETVEISFQIEGKDITFQVIDGETKESVPSGQGSFEGATYSLYNQNHEFLEEFTVNGEGKGFVNNLPYGTYFVKQTKESTGYLLNLDEKEIKFGIDDMPVLLEEYPYYQQVRLSKKYNFENTGELRKEKNIQFEIVGENQRSYGIFNTNDDGIIEAELPYGRYFLHQLTTSFGYGKIGNISFNIYKHSSSKMVINLIDPYILCKIKISEFDFDYDKKINLEGFSYRIYDYSKKKYLSINDIEVFTTNSSGEILFPMEVGYGKYRLEEVEVPSIYQFQNQKIDFTLDDTKEMLIDGKYLIYNTNIYQKLIKGTVYISSFKEVFSLEKNKYQYRKDIQPNVDFELIAKDDIFLYDNLFYSKNEVIDHFVTNDEGKKELLLLLGNYCVRNKKTDEQKCFDLNINEKKDEKVELFLEFLEQISKMDLEYHNYDENGDDIEGTIVEIRNEKDEIIDTGLTDEEGRLKIKELPSGKYCFVQKKIKGKYLLSNEKQCISIDDSKKLWEVSFVNQISKKVVDVPDTLENIPYFSGVAIVIILITIGGFFYQKVHFRN